MQQRIAGSGKEVACNDRWDGIDKQNDGNHIYKCTHRARADQIVEPDVWCSSSQCSMPMVLLDDYKRHSMLWLH